MGIHNSTYQKNANTALVLGSIWRAKRISRVSIARELGLYRSTVTNIINSLLSEQVVLEEGPVSEQQSGRKQIALRLNEKFGVVVGIDLQVSHYIVVGVDITGTVLFERSGTNLQNDIAQAVHTIHESLVEELEHIGCPVLALCVAIPGVVNTKTNFIRHAELFKIDSYDVGSRLGVLVDVPLFLENDANCCAWWHLAQQNEPVRENFLCVFGDYHDYGKQDAERMGVGVGLGISIGGSVYGGSHHAAGEIHTVTWKKTHHGQSGLTDTLLEDFSENVSAYKLFVKDFFSSLVPVISVLDPAVCHVHGTPFNAAIPLHEVLAYEVPQFLALLQRRGCRLEIDTSDPAIVAKGAAMMYLQKLFTVPNLPGSEDDRQVLWDDVFSLVRTYREGRGIR